MPLVGSTVTPIVVFLPLISITGVTGVFFRALAVTVGVALLTSLALALTWTPTLSHYFIGRRKQAHKQNDESGDRRGDGSSVHGAIAGRRRGFSRGILQEDRGLPCPVAATSAGPSRWLAAFEPAPGGRLIRLLPLFRLRPAAGDGRRRLHLDYITPPALRSRKPTAW